MTLLFALLAAAEASRRPLPPPAPDLEDTAAVLLGRALASSEAYEELRYLCDVIGHRLTGSAGLARAVTWGAAEMTKDGLQVVEEPVTVPVWTRGEEHLTLLAPNPIGTPQRPLAMLGLGGSPGTPAGGLTAEVLVVGSFEELERRSAEAVGRIVLYDVPFTTYGDTVQYRVLGADAAARHGAVAALVRSVTSVSLHTPHTGVMVHRDETVARIPAAAITVEDATWLHRLADAGQPARVHLEMGAQKREDALSANVVGELRGRERPDEIVTLGCHLDSWDVGQGAQDDGAGCVAVMEAVALLAQLPVRPRRTVRAVLYTNEESGLRGGEAYAKAHGAEAHVALLEVDTGAGQPLGWQVDVRAKDPAAQDAASAAALADLAPLAELLAPIGATALEAGGSGADIGPTVQASGALGLGLSQDTTEYWPVHHTEADTFDKIDPLLLARNVAAVTVTAWWLAEVATPPRTPGR